MRVLDSSPNGAARRALTCIPPDFVGIPRMGASLFRTAVIVLCRIFCSPIRSWHANRPSGLRSCREWGDSTFECVMKGMHGEKSFWKCSLHDDDDNLFPQMAHKEAHKTGDRTFVPRQSSSVNLSSRCSPVKHRFLSAELCSLASASTLKRRPRQVHVEVLLLLLTPLKMAS